jgi:hypothetical protein
VGGEMIDERLMSGHAPIVLVTRCETATRRLGAWSFIWSDTVNPTGHRDE